MEGTLRVIVDQAVNGRDAAAGNVNGRCKSGGLVIFSVGSFCHSSYSQFMFDATEDCGNKNPYNT